MVIDDILEPRKIICLQLSTICSAQCHHCVQNYGRENTEYSEKNLKKTEYYIDEMEKFIQGPLFDDLTYLSILGGELTELPISMQKRIMDIIAKRAPQLVESGCISLNTNASNLKNSYFATLPYIHMGIHVLGWKGYSFDEILKRYDYLNPIKPYTFWGHELIFVVFPEDLSAYKALISTAHSLKENLFSTVITYHDNLVSDEDCAKVNLTKKQYLHEVATLQKEFCRKVGVPEGIGSPDLLEDLLKEKGFSKERIDRMCLYSVRNVHKHYVIYIEPFPKNGEVFNINICCGPIKYNNDFIHKGILPTPDCEHCNTQRTGLQELSRRLYS